MGNDMRRGFVGKVLFLRDIRDRKQNARGSDNPVRNLARRNNGNTDDGKRVRAEMQGVFYAPFQWL